LSSIEEETGRPLRFVANLLDMPRIEGGGLKVNRDLVSIADAPGKRPNRPSRPAGWRSKARSWILTSVSSPETGRRSS
jgi:two-component system, OmpR family, sensor histidine kinase KdpD